MKIPVRGKVSEKIDEYWWFLEESYIVHPVIDFYFTVNMGRIKVLEIKKLVILSESFSDPDYHEDRQ